MEDRNSGARNSTVTTRRQSTAPTPLPSITRLTDALDKSYEVNEAMFYDWSTCEIGMDNIPVKGDVNYALSKW